MEGKIFFFFFIVSDSDSGSGFEIDSVIDFACTLRKNDSPGLTPTARNLSKWLIVNGDFGSSFNCRIAAFLWFGFRMGLYFRKFGIQISDVLASYWTEFLVISWAKSWSIARIAFDKLLKRLLLCTELAISLTTKLSNEVSNKWLKLFVNATD